MSNEHFVFPSDLHHNIVKAAYLKRGFSEDEAEDGASVAGVASHHGIHTHNALKAIHLDDHMGSGASPQGCCPNVDIEVIPSKYGAVEKLDCKV